MRPYSSREMSQSASTTVQQQQLRRAERIVLPQPVPAMLGEFIAKLVEVSLIGCRLEHSDRLPMRSTQTLRFRWQNQDVTLRGTVARCELQMAGGRIQYVTGLQFCASVDEAPAAMRAMVNALVEPKPAAKSAAAPASRIPFLRDDDHGSLGEFLECSLVDGRWQQRRVTEMRHPVQGFTIALPVPEREIESLCRVYATSNEEMRTRIRAKLDLSVAQARARKP